MERQNPNDYTKEIDKDLSSIISNINNIVYDYYLDEIFSKIKNLSENESKEVLESLINYYLKNIRDIKISHEINFSDPDFDEIANFFKYNKNDKENKNTSRIIDEADYVVDELCSKVIGSNNRILELPLKIEYIENYCIGSVVKKEDLIKALIWIVLKLSIIYNCLSK